MRAVVLMVLSAVALPAWADPEHEFARTVGGMLGDTTVCVTWTKRQLVYRVDAAGSAHTPGETEFDAIDRAFGAWQAATLSCSDFQFVKGDRIVSPLVGSGGPDGENILTFRETNCRSLNDPCTADGSCGNKFHCWEHNDSTIALTTVSYSTRTGVVYDADIEFNASPHLDSTSFLFTTVDSPPCEEGSESSACVAYDLQNTVTHEIGHMMGFAHVENPDSTMAATAPVGEISKRNLDPGTLFGFCSTYPAGRPPTPCDASAVSRGHLVGTNVGTFGCSCGSAWSLAWWGLPLIAVIRRRRTPRALLGIDPGQPRGQW